MGAHSLGGVMAQIYIKDKPDMFKGVVFTGSGLLANTRTILDDGTTEFSFKTPSLTLSGTKDGLFRITRGAVSYWHQITNISTKQAGLHQFAAMEGLTHASFMDSSMLPSAVTD